MLRTYEIELLRLDAGGGIAVSHLVIAGDDDITFDGIEPGSVWTLDGEELAAPPAIFSCDFAASTAEYPSIFGFGRSFEVNGVTYVIPSFPGNAASYAALTDLVSTDPFVGNANFIGGSGTLADARAYNVEGIEVTLDVATGAILSSALRTMVVLDDDSTIELGAAGGGTEEIGEGPVFLGGNTANPIDVSTADAAAGRMQAVRVEYQTAAGGTATFNALLNRNGTAREFLVPVDDTVDLADVVAILSVTIRPSFSVDGLRWADFGFRTNYTVTSLGSGDDTFEASFTNDKIVGKGGSDLLFGDTGEDLLDGGGGGDTLHGGLNDDDLRGEGGNDDLYGGAGHDTLDGGDGKDLLDGFHGDDDLQGGTGNDDLFGGAGNDTLDGGDDLDELSGGDGGDELSGGAGDDTLDGGTGKDALFGGADADTLIDGKGEDTLEGGSGADVFVLLEDGSTDHVTDFRDGTDLLDLGTNFGQLVFTDVAPGEVHIEYRGEVVIVTDTGGTLTSADFSGADFL